MNIYLGEKYETFVREQVASGRYTNAAEVIREAVRQFEDDFARTDRIRRMVSEAEVAFERGEVQHVTDVGAFIASIGLEWRHMFPKHQVISNEPRSDLIVTRFVVPDLIAADRWARAEWADDSSYASLDSLYSSLEDLQTRPPWYSDRSDVSPKLQEFGSARHVLLYREAENGVRVLRVVNRDDGIDLFLRDQVNPAVSSKGGRA